MAEEVKKVQDLLDLPSDNEDKYSGLDEMLTLPMNNESNQNDSTIKSKKIIFSTI